MTNLIPDPSAKLAAVVQEFCARHGMPKTRFGDLALNDPSFVTELEAGREPRRKTVARVLDFIAQENSAASSQEGAA